VAVEKLRGEWRLQHVRLRATAVRRTQSCRSDMAVVSPVKLRCIGHDDGRQRTATLQLATLTTTGHRCYFEFWPPPAAAGPSGPLANTQGTQRLTTVSPEVKVTKQIHRYALKNILRQRVWAADRLHCLGRSQDFFFTGAKATSARSVEVQGGQGRQRRWGFWGMSRPSS